MPKRKALGTRRQGDKVLWRVYLEPEVAVAVELKLIDPIRDRPIFGARSQLVEQLLRQWLAEQDQTTHNPQETPNVPNPT